MPFITLSIVIITFVIFVSTELSNLFIFDRELIQQGEYWRIVSAHFVHYSVTHYSLNIILFGVASWIIEKRHYSYFLLLIFLMILIIGLNLFFFEINMRYYAGLSGLAHGTLFYLALWGLTEHYPWHTISIMLIVVMISKAAIELYSNIFISDLILTTGFKVVVLSHISGIVIAFALFLLARIRK